MALIPIAYEQRIASPAQAEAFYRALGEKRVSVRGCHTREPARIARLVAAIEVKLDHSVSFEAGRLDEAAFTALEELAVARFQYLDVQTPNANLRVWPGRYTWVHATTGVGAAAAVLGAPLAPGANQLGDTRVTLNEEGRGWPIDCETTSIATALRLFRALAGDTIARGHVTAIHAPAKPALERFLVAIRAEIHVVLELDVSIARELAELYAGESFDWQAAGLLVYFPEGRIQGFLKSYEDGDRTRAAWQKRVAKAMKRATRASGDP